MFIRLNEHSNPAKFVWALLRMYVVIIFLLYIFMYCRSKNQKGKKVTERENIKVDRKIAASKGTSKEKDVTKITSKKRPTTPKKTVEKEDDNNTLLSEENVPLNPIEQDTAHDTIQSTLSLRK